MNCPQCGQPVSTDARFCAKCGQKIDSGAAGGPAPGGSAGDFSLAAAPAGTGASAPGGANPFQQAAARLPGLIERAKNIILTPKTEWTVIQAESTSPVQLYSGYVMPMAGFAAVMSFLRMSVVGVPLPFGGTIRTPLMSGLFSGAVTFVLGLIGLYLVGLIINMLAPTFAGWPLLSR